MPIRPAARRLLLLHLAVALLLAGLAPCFTAGPEARAAPADQRKTQAELKAIAAQIERVRQQVQRDALERDRASQTLRSTEVSAARAREQLANLRAERAQHSENRALLARQRSDSEQTLQTTRAGLAAQLRAAYVLGREEPLKLLLNQKDPARAGRMFAYYGYFGRMRADQIGKIRLAMRELEQLAAALAAEDEKLAALERVQQEEVVRLERARQERRQVLATLNAESRSRAQSLQRLQRQQGALEKLLKDLTRALEKYPVDSSSAFARLRGKLAWPVAGKLVARYGQRRAGAVKWNGVLVAAPRGSTVRAISGGRVAYADWLAGLGLLVIVDHGEGYLSLYAHNERLLKAAGAQVGAGEPLANSGDSGGRSQPELYFEIRKAGRPVDPRPWFSSAGPASP